MGSILAVPITFGHSLLGAIESWFKWLIAYIYIEICRKCTKRRFDLYDRNGISEAVKMGLLLPEEEFILESPMDESHLAKASDEVIFYGVNSSSECFMAKISRGCQEETEVGIYLKLRNGMVYENEKTLCHQQMSKYGSRIFTGGNLKMYSTEPMRKWRIFFKGLLRETAENGTSRMVYVKFGLQWRAGSDCFDTRSDINSSNLARSLARMKWSGCFPDLKRFHDAVNSYCQSGVIRGEVTIDGVAENIEVYLFGEKIRYLGNASTVEGYRFSHLSGHETKYGRIIHIIEIHFPCVVESFLFGFLVNPGGQIKSASNINVTKGNLCNDIKSIDISFRTDNLDFRLNANACEDKSIFEFGTNELPLAMSNMTLELNSLPGKGILIQGNVLKLQKQTEVKVAVTSDLKDIPLTVSFSNLVCQTPDITGGKGSSLGKLTQLSEKYENFIVPMGIVVTTSAYEKFITEDILKEVKNLEDILYGNTPGDVKEACKSAFDIVIDTDLPNDVHQSITQNLQREFGDNYTQKMFAVRSSATGEDNEDISAAGQMETFLGVSGLEQIILSLKKCWASQFGYVAVQYKRQNGQVLNTPMAVVVQEMVLCDVAGVLFTCDPVTGNPTVLSITANYGLGESVVSGSEEPDTIILERDVDDKLRVKEKIIGAKNRRTVIKDGGPVKEDVSKTEKEVCSLSEELSLLLGDIAINIEKSYGSERDIEWGYWNNKFYIFQCRPVTSNNEETDYEIDHENDVAMKVENEYFTVCNIGEIMPGAMSPLGLEILLKFFNYTFQSEMPFWQPLAPKYATKGFVTMYNHYMMFATDLFGQVLQDKASAKYSMIAMFGRIIEDEELLDLSEERSVVKKLPAAAKRFTLKSALFSSRRIKKVQKLYKNCPMSLEDYKKSSDLFNDLLRMCTYPREALMSHVMCTNKSTVSNVLLLISLEKANNGEIDTVVYSDIAEILSSIKEVESADVPSAMESLAYHIKKDVDAADFEKMDVEDAEKWLLSAESDSGKRFRDFLEKHGHRCMKELDVRTTTWGENPKLLVKLLQNLIGSVSSDMGNKKIKSFEEILSKLKIPLSSCARILLRYIFLPFSRSGVQCREASKSLLVKAVNEWRKGYKKLARLMVSEGRIPDEDLIFFMTVMEIQELLRNRSPKIIARAAHRRKRHPILDSYIFQEISRGVPKPVNLVNSEVLNIDENFSMEGIPVSRGVAKGYARVALTLDEASFLKPGEILVTYSTDIGWTPYFPTLAGVATELGGLISHGAVISREYGIPCIAGLHGATGKFQTGDFVLLDANKGILSKLPPPRD